MRKRKPHSTAAERLESWRRELERGGPFASAAPRIIAELEAEIASGEHKETEE